MKLMLIIGVFVSSFVAIADWQTAEDNQEVVVKVDGVEQLITIENEIVEELVARSNPFYECRRQADGGWRRCSKRTGRCFGATFAIKSQCEDALNPDDD